MAPRFCSGTQILTPAGPRFIEELAVGNLVRTADGEALPLLRVRATRLSPRHLYICPHRCSVRIWTGAFVARYL
ncbi:Hint domain-containing protein [Palleronia caenipelagi]|uniref:Hint domain-containing protein n=1 Tax=Palleronia caenipelagi TaxID=2489174 RepID=UPI003CCC79CA